MAILFCRHPLDRNAVEPPFDREADAFTGTSLKVDFDRLVEGDLAAALRGLPIVSTAVPVVYRGWMMTGENYSQLFTGLVQRGYQPVTDPDTYVRCHNFSGWCNAIADWSASFVRVDVAAAVDRGQL